MQFFQNLSLENEFSIRYISTKVGQDKEMEALIKAKNSKKNAAVVPFKGKKD